MVGSGILLWELPPAPKVASEEKNRFSDSFPYVGGNFQAALRLLNAEQFGKALVGKTTRVYRACDSI
ncbi:unnamed protein product [Allacma fusca]|uniref:Uncharacterized protein n=1 Tax=Allacma fusca TaxID=39272 RepID=A0A8J2LI35_9HEXA|nr:unnamed protein product [Allacma fusca]